MQRTKAMLARLLEDAASCHDAGQPYGLGRSTVERNIKTLVCLVAEAGELPGVEAEALESIQGLRSHAGAIMEAVRRFQAKATTTQLPEPDLTAEELQRGASRVRERSSNANRDVALLFVLLGTGLKPLELARIRVQDYLHPDGRARLLSTLPACAAIDGKPRPLFLDSERLLEALDAYLLERHRRSIGAGEPASYRGLDPDSALFLTDKGKSFELKPRAGGSKGMTCPVLARTLRVAFKRAGWRWVNAHDARRLVARRLVANGASEQQLCELLGLMHVRAARALLMGEARPTKVVARNLV
jgi:integrase